MESWQAGWLISWLWSLRMPMWKAHCQSSSITGHPAGQCAHLKSGLGMQGSAKFATCKQLSGLTWDMPSFKSSCYSHVRRSLCPPLCLTWSAQWFSSLQSSAFTIFLHWPWHSCFWFLNVAFHCYITSPHTQALTNLYFLSHNFPNPLTKESFLKACWTSFITLIINIHGCISVFPRDFLLFDSRAEVLLNCQTATLLLYISLTAGRQKVDERGIFILNCHFSGMVFPCVSVIVRTTQQHLPPRA